ncbi:hypothetical protein NEICINOT_04185 [Neisseria cinerea ATCC 14685]|uniref:Uncharacterized protein n=1 Tax=Neisseria cinerea ATCC 14685 TaxID=546262 RepID=D0W3E6_NEICI|nr:hypothetical protein NEICINOT_04185 [Neisseria cinerea ATCC 14685]
MLGQIHDFFSMVRYFYCRCPSFTENTLKVETLSVRAVECSLFAVVCRLKQAGCRLIIYYCNSKS